MRDELCPQCVVNVPSSSDVGPKCGYTDQEVDEIAQHCNKRKMAAKRADVSAKTLLSLSLVIDDHSLYLPLQSASRDLFFAFFVKVS